MFTNPIKKLRQEQNLTQKALAEQAGISPTAVLRYEQGLYQEISPKITKALEDETLPLRYRLWRLKHQQDAERYFKELPQLTIKPGEHPFETFRKTITTRAVGKDSRVSFCILLAIHPSVVAEYEKGKQMHMPGLIREALNTAGVPGLYLNSLDQFGAIYHDRITT